MHARLSASILAAAAGATTPMLAASDCTALRGGTVDFDQVRAFDGTIGLPNDGTQYCVPTTWLSWLAYLNNNGFPGIVTTQTPDWSDPGWYPFVTAQIAELGEYCDTNPMGGTPHPEGVLDYIADNGYADTFHFTVSKVDFGDSVAVVTPFVSPYDIWYHVQNGGLVSISIGWSSWNGSVHTGAGAHVVGVAGVLGDCTNPIVLMNNPSSSDSTTVQSPFMWQDTTMSLRIGQFQRGSHPAVTKAMWELDDYAAHGAHLMGIRVLYPLAGYVLPPVATEIQIFVPQPLGGGDPATEIIPFPAGVRGLGVLPHPAGLGAFVLLDDAGQTALAFLHDGVLQTILEDAFPPEPIFEVDRFGNLFIAGADGTLRRISFEFEQGVLAPALEAELEDPGLALVIESADALGLVAVMTETPKLVLYDESGEQVACDELPDADLPGDPLLAFGPDGLLWIGGTETGMLLAYRIELGAKPVLVASHFLPGITNPSGIEFTRSGRLLASHLGAMREFTFNHAIERWEPSDATGFSGLPAFGGGFALTQSRSSGRRYASFEESPDYPEIPPFDALPLCPEDIDDDGAVGIADLLAVLAEWGTCDVFCAADVTEDGRVDVVDLLAVLSAWGDCPSE